MSDKKEYIERGALIDRFDYYRECFVTEHDYDLAVTTVDGAAIEDDVVEVVRCLECKYNDLGDCIHPDNVSHSYDCDWNCYDHHLSVSEEHFCSYGERKDGADNA